MMSGEYTGQNVVIKTSKMEMLVQILIEYLEMCCFMKSLCLLLIILILPKRNYLYYKWDYGIIFLEEIASGRIDRDIEFRIRNLHHLKN